MKYVEAFLLDFVRKSREHGYHNASLDGSALPELPSTIVWVYYYLAKHFLVFNRSSDALDYVQKAIDHTPTLVDLYTLKAKVLKKMGDPKV